MRGARNSLLAKQVPKVARDRPQASMTKSLDRAEISAAKLVVIQNSCPGEYAPLTVYQGYTARTVFVVAPSITRPMVLVTALLALPGLNSGVGYLDNNSIITTRRTATMN